MSDPIHDDSTPPFPPPRMVGEIVGRVVPASQQEQYPLHEAFEMPEPIPRRDEHALAVDNARLRGLLSRWMSLKDTGAGCDLVTSTYDAIYGNNGNSGARAPIQHDS